MATMTREQKAEAVATWERVSADESWISPHQHIEDLIAAGEELLAAQAPPASDPPATPQEDARDYVAELRECHELLTSCVGGVDPDEHPELVARINVVLGGCDVAGVCPAPVDPVPGSVDYWREVAARLGAEVKLMADALKGTTEQRDDALAKLKAQAPPASAPPGLVALVREYQALINGYGDGDQNLQELDDRLAVVQEQLLAYPLPASPRAETTKGDE
jgi:hypothetical protein